jgi:hypothetical protein
MATTKKISELTALTTPTTETLFVANDGGNTYKIRLGDFQNNATPYSGSVTITGSLYISGSNGVLKYGGDAYLINPAFPTLADIHTANDTPWLQRFYNDSFETTDAVMAYFAWNDGRFVFHNESTQSIGLQVNGYDAQNGLLVYSDRVAFVNNIDVTGSILVRNQISTPPGQYFVAYSDTSVEMSYTGPYVSSSVVFSGFTADNNGSYISINSTNINNDSTSKTWWFQPSGSLITPGGIVTNGNISVSGSLIVTGSLLIGAGGKTSYLKYTGGAGYLSPAINISGPAGAGATDPSIVLHNNTTDIIGAKMYFLRSYANNQLTSAGQDLGELQFYGAGNNTPGFVQGASIKVITTYPTTTTSSPAKIVFGITPSGSITPVERVVFSEIGVIVTGSLSVSGSITGSLQSLKAASGSVASFTGTPKTSSVTFTSAFANNLYSVNVIGEDARMWTIQSKTSAGFTINSNSSVALTGPVYWIATAYN